MKKSLTVVFFGLLCVPMFANAQAAANPQQNSHRAYDLKLRECRKQANDQQLQGEEARVYIARCMKSPV